MLLRDRRGHLCAQVLSVHLNLYSKQTSEGLLMKAWDSQKYPWAHEKDKCLTISRDIADLCNAIELTEFELIELHFI